LLLLRAESVRGLSAHVWIVSEMIDCLPKRWASAAKTASWAFDMTAVAGAFDLGAHR